MWYNYFMSFIHNDIKLDFIERDFSFRPKNNLT